MSASGPRAPTIVLASGSPRRAALLEQIGLPFLKRVPAIDESVRSGESPHDYVERMARRKAQACVAPGCVALGADTAVVVDAQILGKPRDQAESLAMLARLSGRSHQVFTGVAVAKESRVTSCVVVTRVMFRHISRAEALDYWRTGEGADKAGGYGIQGIGSIFASKIEGSYSAVVGLPLAETEQLLEDSGVDTWRCRIDG